MLVQNHMESCAILLSVLTALKLEPNIFSACGIACINGIHEMLQKCICWRACKELKETCSQFFVGAIIAGEARAPAEEAVVHNCLHILRGNRAPRHILSHVTNGQYDSITNRVD